MKMILSYIHFKQSSKMSLRNYNLNLVKKSFVVFYLEDKAWELTRMWVWLFSSPQPGCRAGCTRIGDWYRPEVRWLHFRYLFRNRRPRLQLGPNWSRTPNNRCRKSGKIVFLNSSFQTVGGCVAQRKHSRFPPGGPGFESWLWWDFFLFNVHSIEIEPN